MFRIALMHPQAGNVKRYEADDQVSAERIARNLTLATPRAFARVYEEVGHKYRFVCSYEGGQRGNQRHA